MTDIKKLIRRDVTSNQMGAIDHIGSNVRLLADH